jgi:hypothetical protein
MAKVKKREWTTKAGTKKTAWIADYFDLAGNSRLPTSRTRKAADDWRVPARAELAPGQHIKPFIGAVRLAELTPAMIPEFRNTLIREGRSRVMAKKVVSSLGSILATAMAARRVHCVEPGRGSSFQKNSRQIWLSWRRNKARLYSWHSWRHIM